MTPVVPQGNAVRWLASAPAQNADHVDPMMLSASCDSVASANRKCRNELVNDQNAGTPTGTPLAKAGGSRFGTRERTQQNPNISGQGRGDHVDNTATTTSATAPEGTTHGQAQ